MIEKSEAFTVDEFTMYKVDTTAGNVTVTLPDTSTVNKFTQFLLVNVGTNSIIYSTFGEQTINGASDYTNAVQFEVNLFITDGQNWFRY